MGKVNVGGASIKSKIPNLWKNGSFENGLTGYNIGGQVVPIQASDVKKFGSYSMKATVSVNEGYVSEPFTPIVGHKYYLSAWFYLNAGFATNVPSIRLRSTTQIVAWANIGVTGSWQFASAVGTCDGLGSSDVMIGLCYGAASGTYWADGAMIIDLTDCFGAGNEPSKSYIDVIVQYFGGWWDSDLQLLTSDGTIADWSVLAGKKGYSAGGPIIGTMPNKAGSTVYPAITTRLKPAGVTEIIPQPGYYDAYDYQISITDANFQAWLDLANFADSNDSTVKQNVVTALAGRGISALSTESWNSLISKMAKSANAIASNIKNGVVIDGVTGTMQDVNTTVAGDNVQYTNSSVINSSVTSPTKQKEATINLAGTVRVKFDLSASPNGYSVYGQIYKNGVAVGTLQTSSNGGAYTLFSQDFTVAVGDKIQLYVYRSGAANTVLSQQFQICNTTPTLAQ